jgi:hypothetical protein
VLQYLGTYLGYLLVLGGHTQGLLSDHVILVAAAKLGFSSASISMELCTKPLSIVHTPPYVASCSCLVLSCTGYQYWGMEVCMNLSAVPTLWLLMVTTKELDTYQPVDVLSMGDSVLGALVVTG